VKAKIHLKQDYQYRTIWDVIGRVRGSEFPDEWVVSGNHRDAWVYGAVDPNSGTAAMLETVHGIGELLKSGWKPKRTLVFASWDGEEEGLIGSTEWGEQHAEELKQAAAYFNMDVGVSGSKFVPSPQGGTVYNNWHKTNQPGSEPFNPQETATSTYRPPAAQVRSDVSVGDLGSGSDYTIFLQHLGVPSTDVGSTGAYGVYHSVFDNFNWFKKFGDPTFAYEQQMARLYGLEAIRMASADVLPFDYEEYGKEILSYIDGAKKKAESKFGKSAPDFSPAAEAAKRFTEAGEKILSRERKPPEDPAKLNRALRDAERALLLPEGLPNRPWYRHAIYAPGQYTGYAAVVIPGVNESVDAGDAERTRQQLAALTEALQRATRRLDSAR
jgi:N-acetylated-alpha-linked acidic dipeptidase